MAALGWFPLRKLTGRTGINGTVILGTNKGVVQEAKLEFGSRQTRYWVAVSANANGTVAVPKQKPEG